MENQMYSQIKVLVTGGCGFIGANLVPLLAEKGCEITILDNLSRGQKNYIKNPENYNIVVGDIRDENILRQATRNQDAIIHLAAYGSVVESVESPRENFSVNVEGTFQVLKIAQEENVRQIVFSSTGGALIGDTTPPVDETSVPRPISPYGASKLAGEGYCSAFAKAYDMSITALRFANVIGPISGHKKGAVTTFYKSILKGLPIYIFGDGQATRDFLYVGDLCNGIIAALEAKKPDFNVYHLASGREVSISELAEIARNVASVPNHEIIYKPKRTGEVERNFANFQLAKKELGFLPTVTLEEAMKITWNWFKAHQNFL
jgi:UDP-glucose 4-epimerase